MSNDEMAKKSKSQITNHKGQTMRLLSGFVIWDFGF
jgi:hypothetical protein